MSATVIDQLIVTLGLDPQNFTKGQKDAARALAAARDDTKKISEAMTSSLTRVASAASALFLSFEGAKQVGTWLTDLTGQAADLSQFSRAVGMSARELNKWGLAAYYAGGQKQDAYGAFAKLSQDVTTRQTTGQNSELLDQFVRAGVAIYDAQGRLRDFGQMYREYATWLGHFSERDAYNLAQKAGLQGGFLKLLAIEREDRAAIEREADETNGADLRRTKVAEDLRRKWRGILGEVENVGWELLNEVDPAAEKFVKNTEQSLKAWVKSGAAKESIHAIGDAVSWLGDVTIAATNGLRELFNVVNDAAQDPTSVTNALFVDIGAGFRMLHGLAAGDQGIVDEAWAVLKRDRTAAAEGEKNYAHEYAATIADVEKKYGLPRNVLSRVIRAESNFNPHAVNKKSGAIGIAQLLPKFFPGAGLSPERDLDTAGAELAKNLKVFGDVAEAVQAYHDGVKGYSDIKAGRVAQSWESSQYLEAVFGAGAGAGADIGPRPSGPHSRTSNSTTNIGQIVVHVPKGDPDSIAAGINDSIRRENLATQADTGQQ